MYIKTLLSEAFTGTCGMFTLFLESKVQHGKTQNTSEKMYISDGCKANQIGVSI